MHHCISNATISERLKNGLQYNGNGDANKQSAFNYIVSENEYTPTQTCETIHMIESVSVTMFMDKTCAGYCVLATLLV